MIQIGNQLPTEWQGKKILSIVSLVPSITELLYHFKLDDLVIGITKFCVLPKIKNPKPIQIGGTKNPSISRIIRLQPELIIANKEENNLADIRQLSHTCSMIWVTDIRNLNDNFNFYLAISQLFNYRIGQISLDWLSVLKYKADTKGTAAYLIWKDPFMVCGGDTFIDQMLSIAGYINIFSSRNRYPEINLQELQTLKPEFILLSSEPYPFRERDRKKLTLDLPDSKCLLVDGRMFSWYGVRPVEAINYFQSF